MHFNDDSRNTMEIDSDIRPRFYSQFSDICTKISLNLPKASAWRWDDSFKTALVAFEKTDADLVLFPLIKEFDQQWDFSSLQDATGPFFEYFQSAFGMIPGQRVFTTQCEGSATLFAVWWPWGDDINISLRVGLFTETDLGSDPVPKQILLSRWLNLSPQLPK